MPKKKKLSPVEIAFIRRALPYLKRHMKVPRGVVAAVSGAEKSVKFTAALVRKVEKMLQDGWVVLHARNGAVVAKAHRGPGRPRGFVVKSAPKRRRPGRPRKAKHAPQAAPATA